ncbi:L-erythro-3,5-diaminohexanoate dehydrogenase [Thermoleophilia bacterium SCSIO 60948]|nr:L-erythro-3,5-diaminohexanoate dehydrogenase [Thermoleophilia bacterium SCSIO 60948]
MAWGERERLGADRVIAPAGSLPQPADRLDASGPMRPGEIEISVDRLCLDSTSHRQIRESCGGDPAAMAERVLEIVRERGKMHNPVTDSGGVAVGDVGAVGELREDPPPVGRRVVTLASLTLVPLTLRRIVALEPDSPQIDVEGTAYLAASSVWAPMPGDIPEAQAVELIDVYAAASHTRELAPREGGTVCVLGAGHAGRLALAAASDAMDDGTLVVLDVDAAAVERARELGLCDVGLVCDLRDPVATAEALRAAGVAPADLTLLVTNASGCEASAILATDPTAGTLLLFSMATSFQTCALTADGMGSNVRMLVGNGYAPDRGAYALDLARRSPALRAALGLELA